MKRLNGLLLFLLISAGIFAQKKDSVITVHEWGTFTTLVGSDGKYLTGLYLDEEKLPDFVYNLGMEVVKDSNSKGIFTEKCVAKNVTVKMETPVLYFYSDSVSDFKVKVEFNGGLISQWYPARSNGTPHIKKCDGGMDFKTDYRDGFIEWEGKVLPLNSTEKYSEEAAGSHVWQAPRQTQSNKIKTTDSAQVEKYLFYRGIGNFRSPLLVGFDEGYLSLTNTYSEKIIYGMAYYKPVNGEPVIWWAGGLDRGTQIKIKPVPMQGIANERVMRNFRNSLGAAGLYSEEAEAMLKTWNESYFETPGAKIFWIVPQSITDTLLPLTMEPKPKDIKRVMVGRSEILTPRFEDFIIDVYKHGNPKTFKGDRYELAYKERYEQIKGRVKMEDSTTVKYHIYPNRYTKTLYVLAKTKARNGKEVKIEIINTANEVIKTESIASNETGYITFDYFYKNITQGDYLVKISVEGEEPYAEKVELK